MGVPWLKLQNFEHKKRDQPQRTLEWRTCGIVESRPRAERVIEFCIETLVALKLKLELYDDPLLVGHLLFALSAS